MIVRARTEIDENLLLKMIEGESYNISSTPSLYYFFDSGCSSLRFFLRLISKSKRIGVQVFTCSSVLDVILSEGCTPVFLDIDKEYYTTPVEYIRHRIHEMDILVLTHLFGIPNPEYLAIKDLCKEFGVILIDDLCQTYHAMIGNKYLEDLSDNYFYSFFYDKPISSISGGMLKVSEAFQNEADIYYARLPQTSDKKGRNILKSLLLMHRLLSPTLYTKEFRNGNGWKNVLEHWPSNGNIKILNNILQGRWMWLYNKIVNRIIHHNSDIVRMSDIEKGYLQKMMLKYIDHNRIFGNFLEKQGIEAPHYFTDNRIRCSIAKRAIVGTHIALDGVQVGLYNWTYLICSKEEYTKYPNAASIIKSHVNIPCWTDEINKDANNNQ